MWLTWHYFWTGFYMFYFIKGVARFYHESDFLENFKIFSYLHYQSTFSEIILFGATIMLISNIISAVMLVAWSKEIMKFLKLIIYKKERE